jgi:hypothetical protein
MHDVIRRGGVRHDLVRRRSAALRALVDRRLEGDLGGVERVAPAMDLHAVVVAVAVRIRIIGIESHRDLFAVEEAVTVAVESDGERDRYERRER